MPGMVPDNFSQLPKEEQDAVVRRIRIVGLTVLIPFALLFVAFIYALLSGKIV